MKLRSLKSRYLVYGAVRQTGRAPALESAAAALCAVLLLVTSAAAQDSSLLLDPPPDEGGSLTLENSSFMFQKLPPEAEQRELTKHALITVLVDYRSTMLSEGDAENRRVQNLNAALTDWLKFDGQDLFAAGQNRGDLRIAGQLNSQYRTEAEMELRDALTFRIAAEIVDIYPNGNLVIQANRKIHVNDVVWEQTLSGIVSRQSIGPDRTVRSDEIHDLRIEKRELGFVRDGYNRGWFTRWYDKWKPF